VALGRLGGKKGGLARKRALSSKKRSEIARKAARARWSKRKKQTVVEAVAIPEQTGERGEHEE